MINFRIVVVGSPDLLLAAPDPDHDDLLPSRSDTEWTDGEIGSNDAVLAHDLRSPSSLGGFARVCQAVHMLSRVLRHFHMRNTTTDIVSMIHEALNIHRALVELDASLDPSTDDDDGDDDDGDDDDDDDRPTIPPLEANHPALAICSLARLVLYNQYACNEPAAAIARGRVALELEVQKLSLAGIKDLASKTIPQMAREILWAHAQSPSKPGPCPILAHCLYHGATECAWFIREDGDPDMVSGLKDIVAALRFMQTEWQVCKQHLDLLTRGGAIL
ncbi:hypothetical protein QQS21_004326 [Conoideocrella luteorostrata]|uniref:Uncharacterized protein n=1 Tax=Conoideocrella luteorostrata TaxID=1105319 RepID=A0AAJ0CU05_9HYPO|nr:hypothetical protein QQS21_004326 [Conoideocrella luteorostrata]